MKISYINEIIQRLKVEYGKPEWKLQSDAVAVLIQTILSQNTSDTNSHKAFNSLLKHFKNWDVLNKAQLYSISETIKQGGLADVKADYIKMSLQEIKKRHGRIELDLLKGMDVDEARKWLLQLPGVGLKTANCVLLFSLGMPALPVDTHIYRVSTRLRLIKNGSSLNQAHQKLAEIVPEKETYSFHILMIEHGRKTCTARNPKHEGCVLADICPSAGT